MMQQPHDIFVFCFYVKLIQTKFNKLNHFRPYALHRTDIFTEQHVTY